MIRCDSQPVWTGTKYLDHTGIRSPHRPACGGSLYRLRYHRQPYSRLPQQIIQIIVCTHHLSFPIITKLSTAAKTGGTTSFLNSAWDEHDWWESRPGRFVRRKRYPRNAVDTRRDGFQGRLDALKKMNSPCRKSPKQVLYIKNVTQSLKFSSNARNALFKH